MAMDPIGETDSIYESRKRRTKALLARKNKLSSVAGPEEDVVSDGSLQSGSDKEQSPSPGPNTMAISDGEGDDSASEELQQVVDEPQAKKSRLKGLYKPPTHSELQSLKETQDLFSSNLMKLQITELLSEVKPKQTTTKKVESFLHKLKEMLISLPSSDKIDLCDGLSLLRKKVHFPLSLDLSQAKGKFQFVAPSVIKVVGGFLLGTLSKPHPSVDLSLHIPAESLQVKDILNYRYFLKRALFLSIVAGHLLKKRKSLGIKSLHFSADNPLLPTLILSLNGSKVAVRLHTSISDDGFFKRSKLSPDHNNVRRYYLSQLPNSSDEFQNQSDESQNPSDGPPTPHYNAALLLELGAREKHLVTLYSCLRDSPGLVDAVLMCKVWARQRGLDKGYGRLSGFHFSMLVSWLHSTRKLNSHMSSYQAFRVVMQTFVASDWTSCGVSMMQQPLEAYHAAFELVFVDESGLNVFAELSKDRYEWLKHEAVLALRNLDNQSTRGFQALFTTHLPPQLTFDTLCSFPSHLLSLSAVVKDQGEREAILLDGAAWPLPLLMGRVLPTLYRGLKQRFNLLTVLPWPSKEWLVSETPPTQYDDVTMAMLLNTDHAFSSIEVGPPSDSSEAANFREFWGEKAQLRRFKDGSIKEAVVWAGSEGVASQRTVCKRIIEYLLERHAGLHGDCVTSQIDMLDELISLPSYSKHGGVSTGEEVAGGVVSVFTDLGRDLRRLRDLPLPITSVLGCSPAFRHTKVFPCHPWNGRLASKYTSPPSEASQSDCYYPNDGATPPFVPVYKVVCQLETSGKWPDDLEAIAKVKTAFYTYISKALSEQCGLLTSPSADFLDILKEDYVFRVQIHYHRELLLLKDAITKATGSEEARLKKKQALIEKDLVSLPLLTSWLNGVHQQYPAFSPGARLCKRWVSAHLLANHISDEAVELMVAYLFLSPAPYTPPALPLVVFLRFLSLVSTFDWSTEPLLVNFNNELSAAAVSEVVSRFTSTRSSLPSMVIVTPSDHAHWATPSPPVFSRLQLLARESLDVLSTQTTGDVKLVFRPPLDHYHVIIHLHKRHAPRSEQGVDATPTEVDQVQRYRHKSTRFPVVDFDPVQMFVQDLERSYSEFAWFFYDQYGGLCVAVAWQPVAFTPQPFKVMHTRCHVTTSEGMVPDTAAIVADFELLGEGLVKRVEVISYTPT